MKEVDMNKKGCLWKFFTLLKGVAENRLIVSPPLKNKQQSHKRSSVPARQHCASLQFIRSAPPLACKNYELRFTDCLVGVVERGRSTSYDFYFFTRFSPFCMYSSPFFGALMRCPNTLYIGPHFFPVSVSVSMLFGRGCLSKSSALNTSSPLS